MKTFTVIGYHLPDGGHVVTEVYAEDATSATLAVRGKLGATKEQFEVVGVVGGVVSFEQVDQSLVALAPYSPATLE